METMEKPWKFAGFVAVELEKSGSTSQKNAKNRQFPTEGKYIKRHFEASDVGRSKVNAT